MKGFQQGRDLTRLGNLLKISINPRFKKLTVVNEAVKSIRLKNITFHILGPTKKNLDKLREECNDWLSRKKLIQDSEVELFQILDKNITLIRSKALIPDILMNSLSLELRTMNFARNA